jgi:hypothetical protein
MVWGISIPARAEELSVSGCACGGITHDLSPYCVARVYPSVELDLVGRSRPMLISQSRPLCLSAGPIYTSLLQVEPLFSKLRPGSAILTTTHWLTEARASQERTKEATLSPKEFTCQ